MEIRCFIWQFDSILSNTSLYSFYDFNTWCRVGLSNTLGGRKDIFNPRSSRTIDRDRDRDTYSTSRSMTALPTLPSNWGGKGPSKSRTQNLDTSRSMIFNSTTGYSPSFSDTLNQGRGGDARHASSSSSRGVNGRDRDRERERDRFRDRDRDRDSDRGTLQTYLILIVCLLVFPIRYIFQLHLVSTHQHTHTHKHTDPNPTARYLTPQILIVVDKVISCTTVCCPLSLRGWLRPAWRGVAA